jgi:hypothetical protein
MFLYQNFHAVKAVVTMWMVIFILLAAYLNSNTHLEHIFVRQLQPTVSSGNARLLRDDSGLRYFVILHQLCFIVNTLTPAVSSC